MEQRLIEQKQSAGFIRQAAVIKRDESWVVVVIEDSGLKIQLTLQRDKYGREVVRKFAKLDSVANVLKKMGFREFAVFH